MPNRRQVKDRPTTLEMWDKYGRAATSDLAKVNRLHTGTLTYRKIRSFTGDLTPEAHILDVGCGWGRMLQRFYADGASTLSGLDVNPTLLRRCHQFVEDARLALGDAAALPFAHDSFDVTYSVRVLQYLPDPAAGIRELARVTRPGGKVVVVQPNAANPWRRLAYHTVLLRADEVARGFRDAGLLGIHQEYFGFSPPRIAIPGAELAARIPWIKSLAGFFIVAGTIPERLDASE